MILKLIRMEELHYRKLNFGLEQYVIETKEKNYFFLNYECFKQLKEKNILDEELKNFLKNNYVNEYKLIENNELNPNYEKECENIIKKDLYFPFEKIEKNYLQNFEKVKFLDYITSTNYFIYYFKSKSKKYLLKITKNNNNKLKKESEVRKLNLLFNTSKIIQNKNNFIIEEMIEKDENNIFEKEKILNEIKKIHNTKINNNLKYIKDWNFDINEIIENNKDSLQEEMIEKIEKLQNIIDDGSEKKLIHGDLHRQNIICLNKKVYFIDFGECFIGNPDLEFIIMYDYTKDNFWLNQVKDKNKYKNLWKLINIVNLIKNKKFDELNDKLSNIEESN